MSPRASRQQLASLQTQTNFYDNSRGASQSTKISACHLLRLISYLQWTV